MQGELFVSADGISLRTRVDIPIEIVNNIVKETSEIRRNLDKIINKYGLRYADYSLSPVFYRRESPSLNAVKKFINDLESLTKEIPICWVETTD